LGLEREIGHDSWQGRHSLLFPTSPTKTFYTTLPATLHTALDQTPPPHQRQEPSWEMKRCHSSV
jgi:hypothetical protein